MTKVLSKRKILRFTGFHSKLLRVLLYLYWKCWRKPLLEKIYQENVRVSLKICKNHETFLSLNFCHFRYTKLWHTVYNITLTHTHLVTYILNTYVHIQHKHAQHIYKQTYIPNAHIHMHAKCTHTRHTHTTKTCDL